MSHPLDNYKRLVSRVDALCLAITEALGSQITCACGCSSCCAHISIFPVEAAAMGEMLHTKSLKQAKEIKKYILEHLHSDSCPLLSNNRCLLYEARPIICRTHGLPIIYDLNGEQKSDCCPQNLIGSPQLSGLNVIDIDKLNTLLVAVNSIYISQTEIDESKPRLTIAEALIGEEKI